MPNDVVSRALAALCAGDHLTADHASAVLSQIKEGRADTVQTGRASSASVRSHPLIEPCS